MISTNTLSSNVWIHFVLELVFWNNLSRNLCAEISLGAIFEAGWETKVRQFWFKRWGVSQTCSPFFESHKVLVQSFSHPSQISEFKLHFKRWGICQNYSPFFALVVESKPMENFNFSWFCLVILIAHWKLFSLHKSTWTSETALRSTLAPCLSCLDHIVVILWHWCWAEWKSVISAT